MSSNRRPSKGSLVIRRKDLPPERRVSAESLLSMNSSQSLKFPDATDVSDDNKANTGTSAEPSSTPIDSSPAEVGSTDNLSSSTPASPQLSAISHLTTPWTATVTKTANEVLGIDVESYNNSIGGMRVRAVVDGSPVARHGAIAVGDVILAIDGEPITQESQDTLVDHLNTRDGVVAITVANRRLNRRTETSDEIIDGDTALPQIAEAVMSAADPPTPPQAPSFDTPATRVTIQPAGAQHLGITLQSQGTPTVRHSIAAIADDGLAMQYATLRTGDVIVEVNDVSILHEQHAAVVQRIARVGVAGQPLRLTTVAPTAFDRLVEELGLPAPTGASPTRMLTDASAVSPNNADSPTPTKPRRRSWRSRFSFKSKKNADRRKSADDGRVSAPPLASPALTTHTCVLHRAPGNGSFGVRIQSQRGQGLRVMELAPQNADKGIVVGDTIIAVGSTSVVDVEHAAAVALMQSQASAMPVTVLQTSRAHPPPGLHTSSTGDYRTLHVRRKQLTDSFGCRLNSATDLIGFTWISEIIPNDAFDCSGDVRENDFVVKIAGKDMLGCTREDVLYALRHAGLDFTVVVASAAALNIQEVFDGVMATVAGDDANLEPRHCTLLRSDATNAFGLRFTTGRFRGPTVDYIAAHNQSCGVNIGDVILEVNGESIAGMSHADVLVRMGASEEQLHVVVVHRCSPQAYSETEIGSAGPVSLSSEVDHSAALDTTDIVRQLVEKVAHAVGMSAWASASPRDKQHMLQVLCCDAFTPDISALPPSLLRRHTGKASITSTASGPYEDPYDEHDPATTVPRGILPADSTNSTDPADSTVATSQAATRLSTLSGVEENGDVAVREVEDWIATAEDQVTVLAVPTGTQHEANEASEDASPPDTVELRTEGRGMGLQFVCVEYSSPRVLHVVPGCCAALSERILVGDRVIAINGVDVPSDMPAHVFAGMVQHHNADVTHLTVCRDHAPLPPAVGPVEDHPNMAHVDAVVLSAHVPVHTDAGSGLGMQLYTVAGVAGVRMRNISDELLVATEGAVHEHDTLNAVDDTPVTDAASATSLLTAAAGVVVLHVTRPVLPVGRVTHVVVTVSTEMWEGFDLVEDTLPAVDDVMRRGLFVSDIQPTFAAANDHVISNGDRVLGINGMSVIGKPRQFALDLLWASDSQVALTIVRSAHDRIPTFWTTLNESVLAESVEFDPTSPSGMGIHVHHHPQEIVQSRVLHVDSTGVVSKLGIHSGDVLVAVNGMLVVALAQADVTALLHKAFASGGVTLTYAQPPLLACMHDGIERRVMLQPDPTSGIVRLDLGRDAQGLLRVQDRAPQHAAVVQVDDIVLDVNGVDAFAATVQQLTLALDRPPVARVTVVPASVVVHHVAASDAMGKDTVLRFSPTVSSTAQITVASPVNSRIPDLAPQPADDGTHEEEETFARNRIGTYVVPTLAAPTATEPEHITTVTNVTNVTNVTHVTNVTTSNQRTVSVAHVLENLGLANEDISLAVVKQGSRIGLELYSDALVDGVLVNDIAPESAAEEAGFQVRDWITEIQGVDVSLCSTDFVRECLSKAPMHFECVVRRVVRSGRSGPRDFHDAIESAVQKIRIPIKKNSSLLSRLSSPSHSSEAIG
eukprot:m.454390 g.454390  ORF g.454390 m.454390 type:complete len:1610 (+) comp21569_c0_seq2:325-5154(+)